MNRENPTSETFDWKTILYVCVACVGCVGTLLVFGTGCYYLAYYSRVRPSLPSESIESSEEVSVEVRDCSKQQNTEQNLFLKGGMTRKEFLLKREQNANKRGSILRR